MSRERHLRLVDAPPAPSVADDDAWGTFTRRAGDLTYGALEAAKLAHRPGGPGTKVVPRVGRLAGLGTLAALMSAAGELNDPADSTMRNMFEAGGNLAGGLAGGAAGAVIGGTLIPIPVVGSLIGATLLGSLSSPFGKGLGGMVADALEGSPESRALKQAQKQAEMAIAMRAKEMQTLMPLQQAAAELALKNQTQAAETQARLTNDMRMRDSMNQAFLARQQAAAQQEQAMIQAILGA